MDEEMAVQTSETADQHIRQMLKLANNETIPAHVVVMWRKAKRYHDRVGAGGDFAAPMLSILVATAEMVAEGVEACKKAAQPVTEKVALEDQPDDDPDEDQTDEDD